MEEAAHKLYSLHFPDILGGDLLGDLSLVPDLVEEGGQDQDGERGDEPQRHVSSSCVCSTAFGS